VAVIKGIRDVPLAHQGRHTHRDDSENLVSCDNFPDSSPRNSLKTRGSKSGPGGTQLIEMARSTLKLVDRQTTRRDSRRDVRYPNTTKT
jgi:hypothetical protein